MYVHNPGGGHLACLHIYLGLSPQTGSRGSSAVKKTKHWCGQNLCNKRNCVKKKKPLPLSSEKIDYKQAAVESMCVTDG